MTDVRFVAVTIAVSGCISSLPALIIAIRNGWKTDEVHTLVNGAADALRKELKTANDRIALLTDVITRRVE